MERCELKISNFSKEIALINLHLCLGLKNTSLRFCGDNAYRKLKIPDRMKSALVACRSIRNVAMKGFKVSKMQIKA